MTLNKLPALLAAILLSISPFTLADFGQSNIDMANSTTDGIKKISAPAGLQSLETDNYSKQARQGLLLPGEVDVRQLLPSSGESFPPPYGANIFAP